MLLTLLLLHLHVRTRLLLVNLSRLLLLVQLHLANCVHLVLLDFHRLLHLHNIFFNFLLDYKLFHLLFFYRLGRINLFRLWLAELFDLFFFRTQLNRFFFFHIFFRRPHLFLFLHKKRRLNLLSASYCILIFIQRKALLFLNPLNFRLNFFCLPTAQIFLFLSFHWLPSHLINQRHSFFQLRSFTSLLNISDLFLHLRSLIFILD